MTRTIITGVGGFTGRYLAPLLAAYGHEVHGIVHGREAQEIDGAHAVYDADLADLDAVTEMMERVSPHYVIHLAGIAFVAHSDVEQIYRANVVGTRQMLEALTRLHRLPRAVILASSANVYGNTHEGVIDESTDLSPANDYGVSKVAMEYVASLYRDRLPTIVVRPFNYTGRGQSAQFIIPKIIAHVRERAEVIELGNLDISRDFSDVRSVVEIYARLLTTSEAIGGTFNLCSGSAVSLGDVLDMVRRISGRRLEVRVNPNFVRMNEVRILRGSPTRLESVIGPLPAIQLEDTLRWMLDA